MIANKEISPRYDKSGDCSAGKAKNVVVLKKSLIRLVQALCETQNAGPYIPVTGPPLVPTRLPLFNLSMH